MRLIDAEALLHKLLNTDPNTKGNFGDGVAKALCFIINSPTIEAEPVRHGRWVIEMDDMGWLKHTCPDCGYVKRTDIHVSLGWNYCPNCGAKMDLGG